MHKLYLIKKMMWSKLLCSFTASVRIETTCIDETTMYQNNRFHRLPSFSIGTCTILSNHLLQLLYSVPSPCRDWRAVTEQVGFSITLGDWVEWGGGWSRHRTKTAFSIASRLALFLRSVIGKQKGNHCLAQLSDFLMTLKWKRANKMEITNERK